MKLEHFFRLILMSIFQPAITYNKNLTYDNQSFYCPSIVCVDGFTVSLQIHNGNYCQSENGYRKMGFDWKEVEFGFPSMNEKDMWEYSEMYGSFEDGEDENFDVTGTVGRIPLNVMQDVCDKHGGIDWDKTLSIKKANSFIYRK